MNFQQNVACIVAIAFLTFGTASDACAQTSWSLKDKNNFTPATPKPLPKREPASNFNKPGTGSSRNPSRSTSRSSRAMPAQNVSSGSAISQPYHDLDTCIVSFIEDIELPAQESGVLRSMLVKEGQSFKKGQNIAQIDDELYRQMLKQAQMQREMALQRANDKTSIRAGQFKVKLATVEAEKASKLLSKGSKSESEWRRARYSQRVAQEELVAAQNEQIMAVQEAELEQAKVAEVNARIRRHAIQTEFDGYVIKKFRDAGEWVQAGEKVLRVARMDRLYVQGNISSRRFNPFEVADKPVTVTLQLARDQTTTFEGKIVSVGLEKQGSDLFMVKAEVNNRPEQGFWTLLPGSQVKMRIHLDGKSGMSLGAVTSPAGSTR